ncbi:hypothetical protein SFRURICE_020154 [Spodoptera frugiperda]|nr:hypothetical protein SFRURICE_020154 [Spodoptera frugiperda]
MINIPIPFSQLQPFLIHRTSTRPTGRVVASATAGQGVWFDSRVGRSIAGLFFGFTKIATKNSSMESGNVSGIWQEGHHLGITWHLLNKLRKLGVHSGVTCTSAYSFRDKRLLKHHTVIHNISFAINFERFILALISRRERLRASGIARLSPVTVSVGLRMASKGSSPPDQNQTFMNGTKRSASA